MHFGKIISIVSIYLINLKHIYGTVLTTVVNSFTLNFTELKQPNCKGGYLAKTSTITEMHKCVSMFVCRITWDL